MVAEFHAFVGSTEVAMYVDLQQMSGFVKKVANVAKHRKELALMSANTGDVSHSSVFYACERRECRRANNRRSFVIWRELS